MACAPAAATPTVTASQGVLDLRHWQPAADGIRVIQGNWRFYGQRWIDPAGETAPAGAELVPLQRPWSLLQHSGLGYGSYSLRILAPAVDEPLAILIPRYRRSYRAFVNGEEVAQSADPQPEGLAYFPLHREQLIPLPVNEPIIDLVIQARNRVDFLGYAPQPAQIGLQQQLQRQLLLGQLTTSSGLGVGLFIGVKYLLMFLFRRRYLAHLWIGLLGVSIGLHHAAWFVPYAPQLIAGWADQSHVLRLLAVTTFLFQIGFMGFLHSLYPQYFERRLALAYAFCMLSAIALVLVSGPPVFTFLLVTLGPFALIAFGLVIQRTYRMVRSEGAKVALVSFSVMLVVGSTVHDLLWYNGLIQSDLPLLFSFSLLLLLLAFLLEEYDLDLYRKVKQLSGDLQEQVEKRTRQLRNRVDELHLKEFELTRAYNKAEEASRSKSRFLAAASHDLRQPLHAMGLQFDQLRSLLSDAQAEQQLQQIEQAHQGLSDTLSALLDISRLDGQTVVPELRSITLNALFVSLEAAYRVEAMNRDMDLRVHYVAGSVEADPLLLKRILSNLLDNAIKYGRSPGVLLGARRRGDGWSIEVWDTGPGIREEDREKIFTEFVQLDNPGRDRSRGLGLGLSIVGRLCEACGFALSLRSRPGRGSVFGVLVPASNRSISPAPRARAPFETNYSLRGSMLLLVEDDRQVREATQALLSRWGCGVIAAADADAALAEAADEDIDLVLVDYTLGNGCTGLDVIARLDSQNGKRHRSVIITGEVDPEKLQSLREIRYPVVSKPVTPLRLRNALYQALQGGASD